MPLLEVYINKKLFQIEYKEDAAKINAIMVAMYEVLPTRPTLYSNLFTQKPAQPATPSPSSPAKEPAKADARQSTPKAKPVANRPEPGKRTVDYLIRAVDQIGNKTHVDDAAKKMLELGWTTTVKAEKDRTNTARSCARQYREFFQLEGMFVTLTERGRSEAENVSRLLKREADKSSVKAQENMKDKEMLDKNSKKPQKPVTVSQTTGTQ